MTPITPGKRAADHHNVSSRFPTHLPFLHACRRSASSCYSWWGRPSSRFTGTVLFLPFEAASSLQDTAPAPMAPPARERKVQPAFSDHSREKATGGREETDDAGASRGSEPADHARKRMVAPATAEDAAPELTTPSVEAGEESGRQRLKRHRSEMAGRVRIPETWGHETLLQDWKDCSAIDRSLFPAGLLTAREALVEECRKASSGRVRICDSR